MKKNLLLLAAFALTLTIQAQDHSISGGIKLIKPNTSTMTFWYVDESPSHDNIYTDFTQKGSIAIQLNYRIQQSESISPILWFIEGQGYLGAVNGLALNIGAIYKKDDSKSTWIQPELAGVIGYSGKSIGTIQNNDVYIQVNNTKFQDYTNVNASLRNIYFGLKPGLSLMHTTNGGKLLGIGISYQISYKIGNVFFRGLDDGGNSISEREKLSDPNVGFYVDGTETDRIPFNPDGLEFKVIFGW